MVKNIKGLLEFERHEDFMCVWFFIDNNKSFEFFATFNECNFSDLGISELNRIYRNGEELDIKNICSTLKI